MGSIRFDVFLWGVVMPADIRRSASVDQHSAPSGSGETDLL